jgi:hypothetical protein
MTGRFEEHIKRYQHRALDLFRACRFRYWLIRYFREAKALENAADSLIEYVSAPV